MRIQSAIEYLTTYGWALLIIAIVLGILVGSGLLNFSGVISNTYCIFDEPLSCQNAYLSSNGLLSITIYYSGVTPINITALGCNTQKPIAIFTSYSKPVYLGSGQQVTLNISCYNGTSPYSSYTGALFKGYVQVNYTNLYNNLPNVDIGSLLAKVS